MKISIDSSLHLPLAIYGLAVILTVYHIHRGSRTPWGRGFWTMAVVLMPFAGIVAYAWDCLWDRSRRRGH